MHIAMIGTGYVGLVSAACFAEFGVEVTAVDSDQGKIARLQSGEMPIYEPGLDEVVARNTGAGRLTFTSDLKQALQDVDAVFIAVGTPSRRGDGHADLTYLFAAAEQIAQGLTGNSLVVTKSTVPVGTGRRLQQLFSRLRPDLAIVCELLAIRYREHRIPVRCGVVLGGGSGRGCDHGFQVQKPARLRAYFR